MNLFTPSQDHVLELIAAGGSISSAAQSAGVHRNTVHNWIHSNLHFSVALTGARMAKAQFWREEAEQLAASAIDTIRTLITDASAPAGVRLRAAQAILTLAMEPPPEEPLSLADLGRLAAESAAQTVPNSAQFTSEPPPQIVHNSAQSKPAPQRRPSPKVGRNDSCPC